MLQQQWFANQSASPIEQGGKKTSESYGEADSCAAPLRTMEMTYQQPR